MKERIISLFDKSKYSEYGNIDEGIVDILKEINSYENVMTLHSCEGHPFERKDGTANFSRPYIAFIVNEKGWGIFWNECAPDIVTDIIIPYDQPKIDPVFGEIKSKLYSFEIKINPYIDPETGTDYGFIAIYGSGGEEGNKIFWEKIVSNFKKLK